MIGEFRRSRRQACSGQTLRRIEDALRGELRAAFSEEAIIELLLLAGFYRTVSYLMNALKLPPEPFAARLDQTLRV